MDEYIKREALETELNHRLNFLMAENGEYDHYTSGFDEAVTRVEDFPAADVAPVRHGRWISLTECANEGVYCSICKKKLWKSDYAWCSKKSRNKLRSNYCPNCGCRMDGGENG